MMEGWDSPAMYLGYSWLMAGRSGRRCETCVPLQPPPAQVCLKPWASVLTARYRVQRSLLLWPFSATFCIVLRALCALSPAGNPGWWWLVSVKASPSSCLTKSQPRLFWPRMQMRCLLFSSLLFLLTFPHFQGEGISQKYYLNRHFMQNKIKTN